MSQPNVMFEELKKYAIIAGMVASAVTFLERNNADTRTQIAEIHKEVMLLSGKQAVMEKDIEYLKSGLFSELAEPSKEFPKTQKVPSNATSFMFPHPLFFDENLNIKIIASL